MRCLPGGDETKESRSAAMAAFAQRCLYENL